jgi:hypothetical protein
VEGDYFKLISQISGKALTVGGGGDKAPVIQKTYTNAPEQQWKINGL